jgi:hypothetical protein
MYVCMYVFANNFVRQPRQTKNQKQQNKCKKFNQLVALRIELRTFSGFKFISHHFRPPPIERECSYGGCVYVSEKS